MVFDDGDATAVALLAQLLKDLRGAERMLLQPGADVVAERIQLACPRYALARTVLRHGHPLARRAFVQSQGRGDLRRLQSLGLLLFDPAEQLIVDHRPPPKIVCRICPTVTASPVLAEEPGCGNPAAEPGRRGSKART